MMRSFTFMFPGKITGTNDNTRMLGQKKCTFPFLFTATALLILLFLGMEKAPAQDVHFSQFRMTPVILNPGAAGHLDGNIRGHLNYKNQWQSIGAPYRTFAFSADGKLFERKWKNKHLGIGTTFYGDRAGEIQMGVTHADLALAYNTTLAKNHHLSGGVQFGYMNHSVDVTSLEWDSQYDGNGYNSTFPQGDIPSGTGFFDVAGGIYYSAYFKDATMTSNDGMKLYAGVATHHLSKPQKSLYEGGDDRLLMKHVAHANAVFGIKNTNLAVAPGILYSQQGGHRETVTGSYVRYRVSEQSKYTGFKKESAFSLGLHYRIKDAIIAGMLFEYANYAIGVSYDVTTSGLSDANGGRGGIEISLRYITPNPFRTKATPLI